MRKLLTIAALAALSMLHCLAADGTPLPLDPTVRTGTLDNGMTYYIKHHENPAKRADFFIVHNVGALQEADDQNGLAHFLEHMAFNGTKHFPDKQMLEYLAAIGVRFGYNVNASTSRERTVYNISNVPLLRESITDSVLLMLHDWSSYITCDPKYIDKERGVIQEEWRQGYDTKTRMATRTIEIEYAGTQFAKRDIIGDMNIIANFDRQTLVDFYHKWYRPDLQAVIVVGDVDVEYMEHRVKDLFSQIPAAIDPTPKEKIVIPDNEKPIVAVITDPETTSCGLQLLFKSPYPDEWERTRESSVYDNLRREIYNEMVRDRFTQLEKSDTLGFRKALARNGTMSIYRNTSVITVIPHGDDDLWRAFLGVQAEVERIRRHGFTLNDFTRARAAVQAKYDRDHNRLRQYSNTDLAKVYTQHFTRGIPYMDTEEQIAVTQRLLGGITFSDVADMWPEMLPYRNATVIFRIPESGLGSLPTEDMILSAIENFKTSDLHPVSFARLTDREIFRKDIIPGSVVSVDELPVFGAEEWVLSNGARVVWKPMEAFEGRNAVSMRAFNPGGYAYGGNMQSIKTLQNALRDIGVDGLSKTDLGEMLTGRTASLSLNLTREESYINGSSSAEDFELMLQLLHLYMTDPNITDAELAKIKNRLRISLEKSPQDKRDSAFKLNVEKYGEHPWLEQLTPQGISALTATEAGQLYDRFFGNASDFTFYFAGAIPAAEAKELVGKYIGSLPAAGKSGVARQPLELLPGQREFVSHENVKFSPKAEVDVVYHGNIHYDARKAATLSYLSYILGERYFNVAREVRGGTYYVSVKESVRETPYPYCYLNVRFSTNPEMAEDLRSDIQSGFEDMAAAGPTAREVEEARKYFIKDNNEKSAKRHMNPSYWLNKLVTYSLTGLDLLDGDQSVFGTVTPDEIRDAAHELLSQGNRFTSVNIQQ